MGEEMLYTISLGGGVFPAELVGGKASQLAELTGLGLPVPAAFCITTEAYRAFLDRNRLDRWLSGLLGRVDPRQFAEIGSIAGEIRGRFSATAVPDEIAREIQAGYAAIHRDEGAELGPVAVRSSASSEDGRIASFAGQCETLLNVRGASAVVTAVVECWASLHSERALLYRARHGLLGLDCTAGVVVQRLVPADRSAVAFSANPVDGDRSAVVIDATWGLGEAIVGGLVNPDHYVVSKGDLSVRHRQISDKRSMIVPLDCGGTAEQAVPAAMRAESSLNDAEIAELARLAIRLEEVRHHPVDIECAYHGARLAVLQCRPITTL